MLTHLVGDVGIQGQIRVGTQAAPHIGLGGAVGLRRWPQPSLIVRVILQFELNVGASVEAAC
jgi:hypothetical protein